MIGLSTMGSISFGCALVAGRKRVPSPAAGKTALRTLAGINYQFGAADGDWQLLTHRQGARPGGSGSVRYALRGVWDLVAGGRIGPGRETPADAVEHVEPLFAVGFHGGNRQHQQDHREKWLDVL